MLKALIARWSGRAAGSDQDATSQDATSLQTRLQQAHALFDRGEFQSAADIYATLAKQAPTAELLVNLGYAKFMHGDDGGSSKAFEQALSLRPGFAQALVGLGDLAARRNDHTVALAHYDRAIASDKSLAVAHGNRAQSLFAVGRTAEAWAESEWRHEAPGGRALYPHHYDLPRWDGRALQGKLLVHWEQGYGDIIQHLRFLPLLEQRGIDHVFECPPPLLRLVQRNLPAHVIAAREQPADTTGIAAVAGLLSLPHLLGVDAAALPSPPYVQFDTSRRDSLRAAWSGDGALLIGIAWRGSAFDASRHATLDDFLAAASNESALRQRPMRWVSLQKDATPEERSLLSRLGAVDTSVELPDFAATADVIGALDGVISVDTATAHLTGALNQPLCLLLNEPAAVRWMLNRPDSPWYPTARLFRKQPAEPWAPLIGESLRHLLGRNPRTMQ